MLHGHWNRPSTPIYSRSYSYRFLGVRWIEAVFVHFSTMVLLHMLLLLFVLCACFVLENENVLNIENEKDKHIKSFLYKDTNTTRIYGIMWCNVFVSLYFLIFTNINISGCISFYDFIRFYPIDFAHKAPSLRALVYLCTICNH